MAVDAEELIIQPFRELVQKGKEAATNAGAAEEQDAELSQRMTKAAKAVAREGERALKKLQPLWDSQVDKYGNSFKTSMSENSDLEGTRRKLDDLLYDFEDYTDVDGFDEEKFTEIQATARSFALDVIDIIKRLKIDGLPITPPSKVSLFPPLPPLPPLASLRTIPPPSKTVINSPRPERRNNKSSSPELHYATSVQVQNVPKDIVSNETRLAASPWASANPSKAWRSSSAISVDQLPPYTMQQQSPKLHQNEHSQLIFHHEPVDVPKQPSDIVEGMKRCSTPDILGDNHGPAPNVDTTASTRTSPRSAVDMISAFPMPRTAEVASNQRQKRSQMHPMRKTTDGGAIPPNGAMIAETISSDKARSTNLTKSSRILGITGVPEELVPTQHSPGIRTVPSITTAHTGHPTPDHVNYITETVEVKLQRSPLLQAENMEVLSPHESAPHQTFLADQDHGLMLADEWKTSPPSINTVDKCSKIPTNGDLTIGKKSSLSLMKGFCNGAQAFRNGSHWHGVQKQSGYVAGVTTTVGRCTTCGYAHQYDELRMDVDREAAANFTKLGIRFRIRFLYKSHLHTTKMTEAYYGCLFCAHTQSVVHEDDATVFSSSDQLFRHLSRHPQPLPEVPGLTVYYGAVPLAEPHDVTSSASSFVSTRSPTSQSGPGSIADHLNDFDLHFLSPPNTTLSTLTSLQPKLHLLPTATATKDHVQRYGEKKLPRPDGDGTPLDLLQFFVGARIIGVEYPARWSGKWATGWHDGVWGVFPSKGIALDRPKHGEVPDSLGNRRTVVSVQTRWKWAPDDAAEKGWLTFGKGETITNVAWLEKEYWCWSGTNGKGKSGSFPRSHVNLATLREEAVALPRPGSRKVSSTRPMKLFGRARRTSISAASSISGGSEVVEIISR